MNILENARRIDPYRVGRILPILILLLAAGLRLHALGSQSLWNDEGNSLRLAQRPVSALIAAAAQDIHPPGYYLALKAWTLLAGESEFALRALSALAGVLSVAFVYALGKALFAPGVGLVASFLVAISSFNIYYSQEARMYALLAMWAAASMWLFVRWTARPTWTGGILLGLVNAAGLYTQYSYPAVMLTQAVSYAVLWLVWRPARRTLAGYIALNLLTLALFVPLLPTAIQQVTGWPRTGQPVAASEGLSTVTRWLVYGNTSQATEWWSYIWPAVFVLAALLPDWVRRRQPMPWRIGLPFLWLLFTVAAFFAVGLFRPSNLKFLLPVELATALLVGRGAWLLWEYGSSSMAVLIEMLPRLFAALGILSITLMSVNSLGNLYQNPSFARDDYRAMARIISSDSRPGVAIVLDAPNQEEVFRYYYKGSAPIYPLPAGLGGDDDAARRAIDEVLRTERRIYVLYWGEAERDPHHVIEGELNRAAYPVYSQYHGDVRLALYAVPGQASTPTETLNADFGSAIRLQGSALDRATVEPGDVLGITLFWQAERPITKRYKVFIHLLDADGKLMTQRDSEPGNNTLLTTTWQPGTTVTDQHGLLIPPALPAGQYRLIMGLYEIDQPTERLPVQGADHVELGTITVR